jgi:carbonic anhydrase
METLLAGYRRFRAGVWPGQRAEYQALAETGQAPVAAVVACADSRLDPAVIFDAAPGQLFSIRNVANLVPPYAPDAAYHGTSAALEFAVRGLGVRHLIVLGHAQCGGVRALMEGAGGLTDFLRSWMSIAEPARVRALACTDPNLDGLTACEHEIVRLSLRNLLTFPWIGDLVGEGQLTLHGAYYGIASGVLQLMGPDEIFAPVT